MQTPEPSLSPPEPRVMATCSKCRGEIYDTEEFYLGDDGFICPDCLDDMWRELTSAEKALFLGLEVV